MACSVLSPNNLIYPPSFFREWSNYTVPLQSDSLVNDWYAKIYDHYSSGVSFFDFSAGDSKYVVLPDSIKVKYIDKSFQTIIDDENSEVGGDTWINFDSLSDNTLYVVPKIPSRKPILYLTPEIKKALDDYLDSGYSLHTNSTKKRHPDREKRISKYIPPYHRVIFL